MAEDICDIEVCYEATREVPAYYADDIYIEMTSSVGVGDYMILTKGNGASISFLVEAGGEDFTFSMADNPYFLDTGGNPYTIRFVRPSGAFRPAFTNAAGDPTNCFTFTVSNFPFTGTTIELA